MLPKHTFYVDNIFVYQPLPSVKTLYYMDLDLYRYFIGRADQSVNEQVMVRRVDQQLRVTRIMLACPSPYDLPERQKNLASYMLNYLSMMVAISSVFLTTVSYTHLASCSGLALAAGVAAGSRRLTAPSSGARPVSIWGTA